ncbi:MAG: ribonuclease HI [Gammaproteobacteria bacterium]|nr:ribonuclease HI [Gammaproteobacteria bacterium]
MAAKKFYVVWAGVEPGIYNTWKEAERQVKGFPNARYKSFPTQQQAAAAFAGNQPAARSSSATKAARKPKTSNAVSASKYSLTADIDIFCDGACDPNPGQAGTGIAVYQKQQLGQLWYGLYNPAGTNNTAELLGLHHALLLAREQLQQELSVTIHCDSKYAIDCVTKWAYSWKNKGWKKAGGEIKNLDIIKLAHQLYTELASAAGAQLQVLHVRGHAGVEGNELADRMSVVAIERAETDLCLYTDSHSIPELLALSRG